jgi:hypothetical protein
VKIEDAKRKERAYREKIEKGVELKQRADPQNNAGSKQVKSVWHFSAPHFQILINFRRSVLSFQNSNRFNFLSILS